MRSETRLDNAIFQLNADRTRCELWVTAGNDTEKLASGSLKPFLTHLREAHRQIVQGNSLITLQVPTSGNFMSSWFTKGTLERFVRFVTTPDVLERVSIVEAERRQLEEAIGILSAGEHQTKQEHSGLDGEDDAVEVESNGDASKNQLLVAMDARRIMLQKEQVNAFARAAAAGFDMGCMADLMDFAECFGASRLREACLKFASIYKKMQEKGQLEDVNIDADFDGVQDPSEKTHRVRKTWGGQDKTAIDQLHQINVEPEPSSPPSRAIVTDRDYGTPPQQDYRAIPDSPPNFDNQTPSTEGANSQQGTPASSRRLPRRSASPKRRSASPMRKVQIARSGSRRAGMVVVRNINYASTGSFQDSSRTGPSDSDSASASAEENETVSSETGTKAAEEAESNELKQRRLSVQDAINLFERKQKDSLEAQAVKAVETRRESGGKSVLRRWSSFGEGSSVADSTNTDDSAKRCSSPAVSEQAKPAESVEVSSSSVPETKGVAEPAAKPPPPAEERRKSWVTSSMDLERTFQQLKLQEAALPPVRGTKDNGESNSQQKAPAQFGFRYRGDRTGTVSRSWSATSQEDLVLLAHQVETEAPKEQQPTSRMEDQGRFYEQYREIRDAKFRQESGSKKAERDKLKAMHEALVMEKKKAELVPGRTGNMAFERHDAKLSASKTSASRKAKPQQARPTATITNNNRSSPTIPSPTVPRASRQQISGETRSSAARKISPSGQKTSISGTSRGGAPVSSPKPVSKYSPSTTTQRRPGNMSDNPLTRSMPSLAELRKENTRPSPTTTRTGPPAQSKVPPTKVPQAKPAVARHRSISKVMPLEPNGVVPSNAFPTLGEEKNRKPLKKSPVEDNQILTPLKTAQVVQPLSPMHVDSKPFLRKGRGIGPGAGPGAMKMKAALATEEENDEAATTEENDEEDASSTSLESAAVVIEPVESRSVRTSLEMDVEDDDIPAAKVQDIPDIPEARPETKFVKPGIPPAPPLHLDLLRRTPPSNNAVNQNGTRQLTLMQQLSGPGDEFVEPSQAMGAFSYIPTNDRRASLPTFGSSPFTSPAKTTASRFRQSLSPESETSTSSSKVEVSRKKWEAPVLVNQQQQSLHQELVKQLQQRQQQQQQQQQQQHVVQQISNRDGVKGFKRLLKFGRKSRGSNNNSNKYSNSEWVSASTTSEGEDTDESSGGAHSHHHFHHPRDMNGSSNGKSSFFSLSSFRGKGQRS